MPKQNQTMTPRELEICGRAYYVRKEIARWSQPALAREMGITQNQLAGVEYKRSPLRYRMAIVLCTKFDINQRWLALGVLPIQPRFEVPMSYSVMVKPESLFSEVFDGWLDEPTRRIESGLIEMVGEDDLRAGNFDGAITRDFKVTSAMPAKAMSMLVKKLVHLWMNWLPEDLLLEYGAALLKANKAFHSKNAQRIGELTPPAQRAILGKSDLVGKSVLTHPETSDLLPEVKLQLPNLLERLKKVTAETGKKSELADYLKRVTKSNVPLASVSRWLSGEREPGGEVCLLMLKWVEQQERKT